MPTPAELFQRIGQEALRSRLLNHPLVERLRNNPNWKPAADAALDHFLDHKKCTVPSWIKSSTWKQVEMAYDEVMREPGRFFSQLADQQAPPALIAHLQKTNPQEWLRQFRAWAESHDRTTPLLSDEAVSRESIYPDRV